MAPGACELRCFVPTALQSPRTHRRRFEPAFEAPICLILLGYQISPTRLPYH
jgi:hypothetical protein